jgi:hypothetical protein
LARPYLVGFSNAMDEVFLIAAGVMFIAFVLLLFLEEVPLRTQSGIEALAAELAAEAGAVPYSEPTDSATPPQPVIATYSASMDHQPGPVIYGQVSEGRHTPVTQAILTLTDLAGRQLDRDFSGADGNYRLRAPGGGSYLVICASAARQSRWSRWPMCRCATTSCFPGLACACPARCTQPGPGSSLRVRW